MKNLRIRRIANVPEYQPPIDFTQAAAVQNTYYEAFHEQDCEILAIAMGITDADETINLKITIDGEVLGGSGIAVTAGQYSTVTTLRFTGGAQVPTGSASAANSDLTSSTHNKWLKGRDVKIEVRKTTNLGAGSLRVTGIWRKW